MNWGIYEKRKKLIIWAFVLNILIVIPLMILPALGKSSCSRSPYTKDKSRLKQIGTTVAMYYTDGGSTAYPKSPRSFDFDPTIIYDADPGSWNSINSSSPYYFFPDENVYYTGSALKPLAVRKIPLKGYSQNHILFEDGHVQSVSPSTAWLMIFGSEIYKFFIYLYMEAIL